MPVVLNEASVAEMYYGALNNVLSYGKPVRCQGKPTLEIRDAVLSIWDPVFNVIEWPKRKFNYRYMVGEALWNLCSRADVRFLKHLSKGIDAFVQDQPEGSRGVATWAYGPAIAPEIIPTIELLVAHPESRRALWRPGSKSAPSRRGEGTPPCLELVQFHVRNSCLDMSVYMRSNDAYLGMPYDLFTYTFWQAALARSLGLALGGYVHHVGSLHVYEHDIPRINDLLLKDTPTPRTLSTEFRLHEVGEGAYILNRDLNRVMSILENPTSRSTAETYGAQWWECKSIAGLLDMLAQVTTNPGAADLTLMELRRAGQGVGW
jgi:thymidylate synthase